MAVGMVSKPKELLVKLQVGKSNDLEAWLKSGDCGRSFYDEARWIVLIVLCVGVS